MSDRELLEAAAKAAGGHIEEEDTGDLWLLVEGLSPAVWNPLTDDGDALRLAVKLGIVATPLGCVVQAFKDGGMVATEDLREDPYAATRRDIVRAAAALGADK